MPLMPKPAEPVALAPTATAAAGVLSSDTVVCGSDATCDDDTVSPGATAAPARDTLLARAPFGSDGLAGTKSSLSADAAANSELTRAAGANFPGGAIASG